MPAARPVRLNPNPGHLLCDGCHLADLPVVGLMREVEAAIGTGCAATLTIHRCPKCRASYLQMNNKRKALLWPNSATLVLDGMRGIGIVLMVLETQRVPRFRLYPHSHGALFYAQRWFSLPHGRKRPSAGPLCQAQGGHAVALPFVAANTVYFFTLLTTCFKSKHPDRDEAYPRSARQPCHHAGDHQGHYRPQPTGRF